MLDHVPRRKEGGGGHRMATGGGLDDVPGRVEGKPRTRQVETELRRRVEQRCTGEINLTSIDND